MAFQQDLDEAIDRNNSLLCINLDPVVEKMSESFKSSPEPLFEFNKFIVDQTKDLVCSYKPNAAFYEAHGASGLAQLQKTVEFIKHQTEASVILDFKRGDIGNSNSGYLRYAFEYVDADAVTIHPYLGFESWAHHLEMFADKGFFVLCRTSNKGAGELQDLSIDGQALFLKIALSVKNTWNVYNNCMLVVGATQPDEMKHVRELVGEMTILAPGVGAQGGDLEQTVQGGLNSSKKGLIVAVGRSILYSENPHEEAEKVRGEINKNR